MKIQDTLGELDLVRFTWSFCYGEIESVTVK